MDITDKRLGEILKNARKEKKITVKDVAAETNISVRYIEALENEDYSEFPGETFILGFLKTYGNYLKLDQRMLTDIYRGTIIEESQPPIEELTRPTGYSFRFDKNLVIGLISVIIIGLSGYLIYSSFDSGIEIPVMEENNENQDPDILSEINFISQSVPENESIPFILTPERGVSFSVNNQLCKIFIKTVEKDGDSNKAVIGFNIFPEKSIYQFKSGVGDETVLSYNIEELKSLRREIRIVTEAVTDKSARVMVTLSNEKAGAVNKPVGDVPIQVSLFFNKNSYVEFIIDGQVGERGLVKAGEVKNLEAGDRLEIKVGDGGAVDMIQNGKEKVRLGKSGKLVKKIFVKTPNPYDNTQYIIKELGE